ncbi:MAG TPA: glycosyltransferase family 9 protein [Roseiarcus sp.]|nr:glycosyltransferase family 9 protein [Roseiarcus sp.]
MAQPLSGIGDMIWHVPHIRALARHVGAPVTLIASFRSAADQIFKADDAVADVLFIERRPKGRTGRHDGPLGMIRLVSALRARQFDALVLLHHGRTLAFAALCAGVRQRSGYGVGLQRAFLNRGPYLAADRLRLHPFERASAWLAAGGVELAESEPRLAIAPDSLAKARLFLGEADPKPVAIGIGSSEPFKQWGAARFAELAEKLIEAGWTRLVLIGGKPERPLAEDICARLGAKAGGVLVSTGWDIADVAALLSLSAFYVGNDTGFMNMAAAAGLRSFCLFGGSAPFRHSRNIMPILPPDGKPDKNGGMARITAAAAMAAIAAQGLAPPREEARYGAGAAGLPGRSL